MQEIPFILTEWQELNSLLYTPLCAAKRIQYTCITVSTNYIVLGATSGSIYLFNRDPCVFQQFIPLSEGAVFRVQISPDEKTVALATVRGSICLVVLEPTIKVTTFPSEQGKKVTCLCWHDNSTEVYAGDETGKISVFVLNTFKVNGMFQSPFFVLMNLDSKIVQINFASSLLLISTLNRCYICDTVLEQFKQIGNKPRDGEFGACFLKTHSANNKIPIETKEQEHLYAKKGFSMSKEVNNRVDNEECLPKIYCARPGSRLWEVSVSGVVHKTHQFKEALAIAPLSVYKPSIGKLFKLKKQDQIWPVQSINFAQLFVISHKYLFSYTTNGLYIFDPQSGEVILWNDEFPDIFMAHIAGDKIYLMSSSGVFHCLSFESVDSLILKLHDKKLYKECLEMCQILRPQITNSITESCDIDIKEGSDIAEKLTPIISLLKSNRNTQPIKLESGIVLVNTGNGNSRNDSMAFSSNRFQENQNTDEMEDLLISLNLNGKASSPIVHKQLNEKNHNTQEHNGKNGFSEETKKNEENKIDETSSLHETICNVQADLETLYEKISSQMKPDITEKQLEEVVKLFIETLDNVQKKYEVSSELQGYLFEVIRSAELHYCNSLLENLPIALLQSVENQELIKHLVKIFLDINSSKNIECSCGTSYPNFGIGTSKSAEPKFFEIGKILLEKLLTIESDSTSIRMCNQIPYMWRYFLSLKEYAATQRIPDSLLKQCLQSRDNVLLSTILPTLDEQQWKLIAQGLESMKNGRCVNCSKPYDNEQISSKEFAIDWSGITQILIKKLGPSKIIDFLSKINDNLPYVTFDKSAYQSIIFSTLLNHHGLKDPIELDHSNMEQNSTICSPKILQEVVQTVEKDLEEPVNKELFGSGPHHWGMRYNLASSTCPCCTLSLQTPVLLGNNGIALFPCGHAYHVNCMIQKKISRCNLHAQ